MKEKDNMGRGLPRGSSSDRQRASDGDGRPHGEQQEASNAAGAAEPDKRACPFECDDGTFGRGAVVKGQVPLPVRRRRDRSGMAVMLGVVCVGCVLVTHTFWGEIASAGRRQEWSQTKGAVQSLYQKFGGDSTVQAASGGKFTGLGPSIKQEGGSEEQSDRIRTGAALHTAIMLQDTTLKVSRIEMDYSLVRAVGGQIITVHGSNFGDEDADIQVRIGATLAARTIWESQNTLLVKTPPGVGKDLDLTVAVEEPAEPRRYAKLTKGFSYSPPFIFDMSPFIVGQPVMGPMDVTIHAYGLGTWDTKPVALINGQQCGKTTWVDNQTVVCSLREGMRIELENPEVKVAGQRSHCGIIVPGVCTVSHNHGSVNSVSRLKEEIRLLRERGLDLNELKKKLYRMKMRSGVWLDKNGAVDPCDTFANCYPTTFIGSISSALLMMMGMGSVCLLLLMIRPLSQWVQKEFFEVEEELDENDPNNALALRAREFDSRITLTGL